MHKTNPPHNVADFNKREKKMNRISGKENGKRCAFASAEGETDGLTKREFISAKILAGHVGEFGYGSTPEAKTKAVKFAVEMTDILLSELAK